MKNMVALLVKSLSAVVEAEQVIVSGFADAFQHLPAVAIQAAQLIGETMVGVAKSQAANVTKLTMATFVVGMRVEEAKKSFTRELKSYKKEAEKILKKAVQEAEETMAETLAELKRDEAPIQAKA